MPKTEPMKPDKPTMMTVSTNESHSMSIKSEDMACDLLDGDVMLAQIFEQLREGVRVATRQNRERAEALTLHLVDLTQQDVDVNVEHSAGFGNHRARHFAAHEAQAHPLHRIPFISIRRIL